MFDRSASGCWRRLPVPHVDLASLHIAVRARTLFAAVHGLIWISLEDRFTGIAPGRLEEEVGALAGILAEGIAATRR